MSPKKSLTRSNIGRRFEPLEDRRMLAAFELSSLLTENGGDGSAGFVADEPSGNSGLWEISTHGDVNGDGFDDLVVSAPFVNAYIDPVITTGPKKDRTTDQSEGVVYVVFGDAQGIPAELNLTSLNGTDGFTIYGPDDGIQFGTSVAVGDINGDEIDDIAFDGYVDWSSGSSTLGKGAFVLYGQSTWGSQSAATVVEVQQLHPSFGGDGSLGFFYDVSGESFNRVSNLSMDGDLNNDGLDDFVVSHSSGAEVRVVYGSGTLGPLVDSSTVSANAVTILPPTDSSFANAISSDGDLNGDGVDDLVIGSHYGVPGEGTSGERVNAGQVFVFYGGADFVGTIDSRDLLAANGGDGTEGFVINGVEGDPFPDDANSSGDRLGHTLSTDGDFNGDGVNDLAISAFFANHQTGEAYVLFGKSDVESGFPAEIEPATLDGSDGFVVRGVDPGDRFGSAIVLGDLNGDGFSDLISTAPYGDPEGREDAGEVYVIYGGANAASGGAIDLTDIVAGNGDHGFVINGIDPGDRLGDSHQAGRERRIDVGDLDADGNVDVSIATKVGITPPNRVYTVYGGPNILPPPPAPTFSIDDAEVTEGDSGTVTATFTVTRSGDSSGTDTVDFATADDTASIANNDYIATSGTLTFDPGVASLPVEVIVNGDTNEEGSETFEVNLINPSVGASLNDGVGIGTILDDDAPLDANVIYVWDIQDTLQTRQRGKNFTDYRIVVDIRQDSNADGVAEDTDAAIAGVAVTVELRDGGGALIGTYSGLTNDQGLFETEWIKNLAPGDYRAEVTDLALAGFAWDPFDLLDATDNDEDDEDNPYEHYTIG